MKRLLLMCLLAVAALTATHCASAAPPFPLRGSRADLERLAGSWWGEYQSVTGRHGTIAFTLTAGADEAHGSVVMIGDGLSVPYRPYEPPPGLGRLPRRPSQLLTIRFASVERGQIQGQLDPYWDPMLRTMATTMFWGRLEENQIEGTFSTTYRNRGADIEGHWNVRRER